MSNIGLTTPTLLLLCRECGLCELLNQRGSKAVVSVHRLSGLQVLKGLVNVKNDAFTGHAAFPVFHSLGERNDTD